MTSRQSNCALAVVLTLLAAPAAAEVQGTEQPELVGSHNIVRKDADPEPVPPLPALTWSITLATAAQIWASACTWSHSVRPPGVGENLYASTASGEPPRPTPATAVFDWASEAQFYDYAANTCSGTCGHYTQIVWRPATQLGCGVKRCTTGSPFGPTFPIWYIWVCQYNSIQSSARPYLCDYDSNGSTTDLCLSTLIFADGFESGNTGAWEYTHNPP